jgi:hypothetical protein
MEVDPAVIVRGRQAVHAIVGVADRLALLQILQVGVGVHCVAHAAGHRAGGRLPAPELHTI